MVLRARTGFSVLVEELPGAGARPCGRRGRSAAAKGEARTIPIGDVVLDSILERVERMLQDGEGIEVRRDGRRLYVEIGLEIRPVVRRRDDQ